MQKPTIPTHTYLNLHIVTYLHIPTILTHTKKNLHIVTYLQIPTIPINSCLYFHTSTCSYLHYLHIHTIPTHCETPSYTCTYLLIPADTCVYMHILAHTLHPQLRTGHILATSAPFDPSQRTDLITVRFRQIVLGCGTWSAFATI